MTNLTRKTTVIVGFIVLLSTASYYSIISLRPMCNSSTQYVFQSSHSERSVSCQRCEYRKQLLVVVLHQLLDILLQHDKRVIKNNLLRMRACILLAP